MSDQYNELKVIPVEVRDELKQILNMNERIVHMNEKIIKALFMVRVVSTESQSDD